jgi:hypothetical protein
MKAKILGEVVFSGDLNPDADGAEAALLAAGFDVVRMPEHFHYHLAILGDEFLEASKSGTDADAIWEEIREIVKRFGGDCHECGEIEADHIPFLGIRLYGNS